MNHYANLEQDEDGWDFCTCDCGWVSPPCPDTETAYGFHTDHVVSVLSQGESGG